MSLRDLSDLRNQVYASEQYEVNDDYFQSTPEEQQHNEDVHQARLEADEVKERAEREEEEIARLEADVPFYTPSLLTCNDVSTTLIDSEGAPWASGRNEFGELGLGYVDEEVHTHFGRVVYDGYAAASVASGDSHTLMLTRTGEVYAWGDNAFGQLGLGDLQDRAIPTGPLDLPRPIVEIACGHHHSIVLAQDGRVWTFGNNESNQVGGGYENSIYTPRMVTEVRNVVAIAGGDAHTAVVTLSGSVWTWGSNEFGQTGFVPSPIYTPRRVREIRDNIIAVACGENHTVVLSQDGNVWTWGNNDYDQLGRGTFVISQPRFIITLRNIAKIACGYNHTIALSRSGVIWTWGSNEYGQLGLGAIEDQTVPEPRRVELATNGERIVAIAGGEEHTAAMTQTGEVYTWGNNEYGQLGLGNTDNQSRPQRAF